MHRRHVLVGVVVVVAYVVVVSATVALRADHVRPLYDGFVAPPSYRFVDPPAFFASGNTKPEPTSATIALGPTGSEPAGVATPDGQFVVNLGQGAIPTVNGATTVSVRITPLAPKHLHPVLEGERANGNAYRVQMTYEPRGGTVTHFAKPGTLLVEIPELGQRLFISPNATKWSPVAASVITPRQLTMTASFGAPGYYVAATSLPELAAPPGHSSHAALVLGAVTAALAALMFLGAFVVVRRRRAALGSPP